MLVSGADPHTGPGDRIFEGEGGAAGQNGYAGMGFGTYGLQLVRQTLTYSI
jgi:hypothetical protein